MLNSLLREAAGLESIKFSDDQRKLELTNKTKNTLKIELSFYSSLGRHSYRNIHQLDGKNISIQDSLDWVINFSCDLLNQENAKEINDFKNRVIQSQINIEKFLNDLEGSLEEEYAKSLSFIQAESLLILGHSFHPYPKARDGFNEEDFKKYSPEYRNGFSLAWALADEDILVTKKESNFNSNWMNEIAILCLGESLTRELLEENKVLLPIHPWQMTHIRSSEYIKHLENEGRLRFIHQDSKVEWFSTSSVRSIYSKDCKYMLKFSMSLRLTNSIRHLQQEEVDRGIQVCDVFNTTEGKKLVQKWPNFEVLHEPAYSALMNRDGTTSVETIVSCRINPFTGPEKEEAILLATLNQLSPRGTSLLDRFNSRENTDYYLNWFQEFTKVAIIPLMDAQANFGIFFGAHQQNIILKLNSKGLPTKLYFRDCQGTGYSEEGYKQYNPYCAGLTLDNGNILNKEMGQKIFCYYLIINTAFDTATHLAKISGIKEVNFMEILRKSLKNLKENGVKDSSCIDYLLNEQYLWVKGNYKCCLKEINENTMKNPTDIYIPMNNPIMEGDL